MTLLGAVAPVAKKLATTADCHPQAGPFAGSDSASTGLVKRRDRECKVRLHIHFVAAAAVAVSLFNSYRRVAVLLL